MLAGDDMRPEPLQRRRGRIAVGHVDQPHRRSRCSPPAAARPPPPRPGGDLQHAGDLSLVAQHGGRRGPPPAARRCPAAAPRVRAAARAPRLTAATVRGLPVPGDPLLRVAIADRDRRRRRRDRAPRPGRRVELGHDQLAHPREAELLVERDRAVVVVDHLEAHVAAPVPARRRDRGPQGRLPQALRRRAGCVPIPPIQPSSPRRPTSAKAAGPSAWTPARPPGRCR